MGSPWPSWPPEPMKAPTATGSIPSVQNNNNNNNNSKGANYSYDAYSYYNNHHNNDFHQNVHFQQQHFPNQRFVPGQQIMTNDTFFRRRFSYPYFTYDGGTQPTNNNTISVLKPPSQQTQFATFVKEIPTWNIYYSDQKHRIIDFTDKNNSIRPDSFINQLVSLCFVDTCITKLTVDAIVNSTTEDYRGAAGVDRLIQETAGKSLQEVCRKMDRLGPGRAEISGGYALPAKYIIHTNGPLTEDAEQLTGCYVNSLNLFLMHRLRTIAFPCISTGRKGVSKKFAAEIALRTVRQFLEEHKQEVDRVIFCLHHQKDIEIYLRYMQIYFPVVDPELHITT